MCIARQNENVTQLALQHGSLKSSSTVKRLLYSLKLYNACQNIRGQTQRPHRLRHVLPTLTPTLVSWV